MSITSIFIDVMVIRNLEYCKKVGALAETHTHTQIFGIN